MTTGTAHRHRLKLLRVRLNISLTRNKRSTIKRVHWFTWVVAHVNRRRSEAVDENAREALIEELVRLEPELMRARFSVQPPPLLEIDVTMLQFKALMVMFCAAASSESA